MKKKKNFVAPVIDVGTNALSGKFPHGLCLVNIAALVVVPTWVSNWQDFLYKELFILCVKRSFGHFKNASVECK